MSVLASRPVLRWALPVGVAAAVIGGSVLGSTLNASADVTLPQRDVAQLLADLQTAQVTGASGTVVETADLGLPSLPAGVGGDGSSQLNSLVTGSHTLKVWYSGPDKARISLQGALGESDLIMSGSDVWEWSSQDNSATHFTLPADGSRPLPSAGASALALTPQQAARQVLELLGSTTSVTTEASDKVAGRPAYELVVSPRDDRSRVAKIRVAIDGTAHIPTRVQVYARGNDDSPAFEIGFREVNFSRPDPGVFDFTPPAGAKIEDGKADLKGMTAGMAGNAPKTAVIGKGWTSVLVARLPEGALAGPKADGDATKGADHGDLMGRFLDALPTVSGPWGSGRLLQAKLFSVLLTDDGRMLVGAVDGDQLQQAAADPAAALK